MNIRAWEMYLVKYSDKQLKKMKFHIMHLPSKVKDEFGLRPLVNLIDTVIKYREMIPKKKR